jgi:hypothetical protein
MAEIAKDMTENAATTILPATGRCLKYKPKQAFGAASTFTRFRLRGIASRNAVEFKGS